MQDTTQSIELYDPATDKWAEVTLDYDISVEPTEYDGPFLFYQGGASMEGVTSNPFTFKGNTYTTLEASLFPYLVFNDRWFTERKKDLLQLKALMLDTTVLGCDKGDVITEAEGYISDYAKWLFEEYVAPSIEEPKHHYRDSRFD